MIKGNIRKQAMTGVKTAKVEVKARCRKTVTADKSKYEKKVSTRDSQNDSNDNVIFLTAQPHILASASFHSPSCAFSFSA
jgi:hypothetical protein